ncbi:MAG: hypothetical protein KAS67_05295 [Thermoplasmata archaeon]|nr:hypothetical protein [Thermoplasmata archaeon]
MIENDIITEPAVQINDDKIQINVQPPIELASSSILHLQVQDSAIPGYKNLTNEPFEASIQEISTLPIPLGGGTYKLGDAWITDVLPGVRDISGNWSFNIHGKVSSPAGAGTLRAEVYSLANGWLFSAPCLENISGHSSYHNFTWIYEVPAGLRIPDNDRIYAEFWLDATAGGIGNYSGETLNPDFTSDASSWTFFEWEKGPNTAGDIIGNYWAVDGNPTGFVDIVMVTPEFGPAVESTYSGYWEQAFTTGFVPTTAELVLDWSCWDIGSNIDDCRIYAFVDTASGAPTLGTEAWSQAVTTTSSWASVGPIDVSAKVNADTTYYLKIAFREVWSARFEIYRIGFDNVKLNWSASNIDTVFTMGYDNPATPSSINIPLDNVFDIPVQAGWNFISTPLTSGSEPDIIFAKDYDTTWDKILLYNASDSADKWKTFSTDKPASLNDLDHIDHTMGFWINITDVEDGNLTMAGAPVPASTIIQLKAGWNMVGYPTLNNSMTVADALWGTGVDKVEAFDPGATYKLINVGPTYVMKPGEGYWVHVPVDTVWTVDW